MYTYFYWRNCSIKGSVYNAICQMTKQMLYSDPIIKRKLNKHTLIRIAKLKVVGKHSMNSVIDVNNIPNASNTSSISLVKTLNISY